MVHLPQREVVYLIVSALELPDKQLMPQVYFCGAIVRGNG
jgi:hypothetical protein